MSVKTKDFVKEKIREYYQRKDIEKIPEIERREFGFGNDKKIDYRHFAFKSEDGLRKYLVENAPLYASFSAAYYEFPEARPMPKKNILGADLIFEFDADCKHDTIACEICLDKTKEESVKLVEDFLIPDFGYDKKDIYYVFSGSRGYHIHVRNDDVRRLPSNARKEIVDYLQAIDIDVKKLIRSSPRLDSKGWKGRLAQAAYEYAKASNEKKFEDKKHILKQLSDGNYDLFKGPIAFWERLLKQRIVNLGSNIDQSVTLDIAKLIRVPSTIHGGSSLLCMYVVNLDKFDPFKDAVVFYNPPNKVVFKQDLNEFTLKDQTFGPFKAGEGAKVPEYVAMFLACKGVAEVIS